MQPGRTTLCGIAGILLLGCFGCNGGAPKPTATNPASPAGTRTPAVVKAWVVLHEQDGGVGYSDNWGSRLTEEELTGYMRNLVRNERVFGPDAKFIWDGQVREVRFPLGPKLSERRVDADWSTTFMNSITAGAYDSEAINIYFVGYVQTNFNQPAEKPIGWTVNPEMVGQEMHHYWRPFILINDEDWNTGVHQPVSTTRLIMEHEMGH